MKPELGCTGRPAGLAKGSASLPGPGGGEANRAPPGLRTLTLAGSTPDSSATSSSAAIRRILGLAGGKLNAACAQFHVWRPWRRPGPAWPRNPPGEGGHRCGQLLFPARRLIGFPPLELDSPNPCPLSPADGAGHSPGSCRFKRYRTGQGGDSPHGLSDQGPRRAAPYPKPRSVAVRTRVERVQMAGWRAGELASKGRRTAGRAQPGARLASAGSRGPPQLGAAPTGPTVQTTRPPRLRAPGPRLAARTSLPPVHHQASPSPTAPDRRPPGWVPKKFIGGGRLTWRRPRPDRVEPRAGGWANANRKTGPRRQGRSPGSDGEPAPAPGDAGPD